MQEEVLLLMMFVQLSVEMDGSEELMFVMMGTQMPGMDVQLAVLLKRDGFVIQNQVFVTKSRFRRLNRPTLMMECLQQLGTKQSC